MKKNINCETHEICVSSDSNLPTCKCWCAECKEYMAEARARGFELVRVW